MIVLLVIREMIDLHAVSSVLSAGQHEGTARARCTCGDLISYTRSAADPDAGHGMVLELLWPVDDQQRLCTEHCMC